MSDQPPKRRKRRYQRQRKKNILEKNSIQFTTLDNEHKKHVSQLREESSNPEEAICDYYLKVSTILDEYYPDKSKSTTSQEKTDSTVISSNEDLLHLLKDQYITESPQYQKLMEFLQRIDPIKYGEYYHNRQHLKFCPSCQVELDLRIDIGFYVCPACGSCEKVIVDDPQINNTSSTPAESSYKRSQHFSNRLDFLLGKKHVDISVKDLNRIVDKIESHGLRNEELTCEIMRKIFKSLGLNNHYYNIPHILHIIINRRHFKLSNEEEQILHHIFHKVETSFNKHCPPERVNFTNYAYTKRKILEALGYDELAEMLPLPKQEDRLIWHDEIWAKMAPEVGLQYLPSN